MKTDKKSFLEKLKTIEPTIAKSGMVELFTNIIFRNGSINSYNGNCGTSVPVEITDEFAVSTDLIKKVADCYDDIDLVFKKGQLILKSGKYKSELATSPTTGFPDLKDDKFQRCFLGDDFVDALKTTSLSYNHKEIKFQGVILKGCYAYSWDGYRATRVKLSFFSNEMFIPIDAVDFIIHKGGKPNLNAGNTVLFSWEDGTDFITRLGYVPQNFTEKIDSMFAGADKRLFSLPKKLIEVVKRVGKDSGTLDRQKQVLIESDGQLLAVSAKNEKGESIEEVENDQELIPFRIAVDPANFMSAMKITNKVNLDQSAYLRFHDDKFDHIVSLYILEG